MTQDVSILETVRWSISGMTGIIKNLIREKNACFSKINLALSSVFEISTNLSLM